jgi:four helix bundle protein
MGKGIENFKVYRMALRLELFVCRVVEIFPQEERFRSVDQLKRSASSVTDNISESYHRFSYGDKINRIYIARGEAGETRDGIAKAHKKGFVSKTISEFTYLKYTELIKAINGYINYLKSKKTN